MKGINFVRQSTVELGENVPTEVISPTELKFILDRDSVTQAGRFDPVVSILFLPIRSLHGACGATARPTLHISWSITGMTGFDNGSFFDMPRWVRLH